MGPRGDAILEFDWSVGKIMQALDSLNLADKTLLIVTSDNGPVVDDGYRDHAVELLNGHTPAGPLRGGKYSLFDGGTRVIFIARWPGRISPGTSDALFSQIDLMASLAAIASQQLPENAGTDSFNHSDVLLGKSQKGREWLIEHSGRLAIIRDNWKYIVPGPGPRFLVHTATETGNDTVPQLYNLEDDPGEKINLAPEHPEMVVSLMELLDSIKGNN
jgi:arylsulfatase A-like enzyme